ncbi:MinD-like ATPase involved in chromosome partitioning or flagellar assembly [Nonomuraea polychroma]|uniref:MinD-like ATPase involved in chromosome partitioning or flagellar assembly n=1 Tax=Nonomuraea polychroma TaxID=46176 RepID=A0A438MGG5_9ACTN|nr:TcpE family conjugal transfer membrane protein [Nonomuraea polychroma]RVX44678.1 MinD-like ATPase involved in chromosome partitioning or flagellar assembly [Nonomuraea polychroma]
MDLPTYTNIWRIEKRLYKLYDLRLPMPLPIVWIGVFVGVFIPWSLLLILVGVPVAMPWHVLFLVPPGIVTWLSTRPVIEGKRLTELLESHLRYLGEPKAWYRLKPVGEPETITFAARVWRTSPARAKAKRPGKSRHPQRRREEQRIAGPRQVRPAVAAAAAAAGHAPVAEPAATRTGWGARRGAAAPALKAQARQPAPAPARRDEGLSGGPGHRQDLPVVVMPGDDSGTTSPPSPARVEREPSTPRTSGRTDSGQRVRGRSDGGPSDSGRSDGARTDSRRTDGARKGGGKWTGGRRFSAREGAIRQAASQQAALRDAALREAAIRDAALREPSGPEPSGRETTDRAAATPQTASPAAAGPEPWAREVTGPEAAAREVGAPEAAGHESDDPETAAHVAAAPEIGAHATTPPEIAGHESDDRETAGHESRPDGDDGRGSGVHERTGDSGAHGEAEDVPGAVVPIRTAQSRRPAAGKPIDTEALRRLRKLAASADAPAEPAADRGERAGPVEGDRPEDEVARDQHRKGQPPKLGPALAVQGSQRVWPPLNPNAKPLPRPGVSRPGHAGEQEPGRRDVPGQDATAADEPVTHSTAGDAPSEGAGTRPPRGVADTPTGPSAPAGAGNRPRLTPVPSDDPAVTGEGTTGDRGASAPGVPDDRSAAAARGRPAPAEHDRPAAAAWEQSAGAEGSIGGPARGGPGAVEGLVGPVPSPGETRVRRVESVIGRDSGGWRRIAQVVVGGNNVRTDGSEIDEARARAVFSGSRRIVVLGCTGGAGQSTTALMLGHTFATYRDDRVVAVDANTGGTTLTSRIQPETPETLTSLLSGLDRVSGYLTMRGYTTRTASGLEVISADTDAGAEQRLADRSFFSDHRLGESMRLLDRHYKLAVIDPAAALAARLLPYADQLVLVVPASEEASEAVAMTYEWLDGHGCAELRRRAVMVVNGVSRRSMADVEQAESVARGRCRAIVRVPWEDDLAPGGAEIVDPGQLRAAGRRAYLALAGVVVAGFAAQTVRPSEEELASDPPGTRIGER